MLSIIYGDTDLPNFIFDPDTFFNHTYEDEWITDDLSKKMIEDVDKSTVLDTHLIKSPVFGGMPVEKLSGGVKTLILIAHDDQHIFNASACGDNCAKWLIEIGKQKDVTVRLGYLMDFGDGEFEITVQNTGRVVRNLGELDDEVIGKGLLKG